MSMSSAAPLSHVLGHPYGDNIGADGDHACGRHRQGHDAIPLTSLCNTPSDFQFHSERGGLEVHDVEISGDESRSRSIANSAAGCVFRGGSRGGHRVTVHEGRKQPPVYKSRNRNVIGSGCEISDCFITIHLTVPRLAPSAMRRPSSGILRVTE